MTALILNIFISVTTANNVAEALRLLRSSERFDLVMTEVHMPDVHGFQFVRQIIEEFNLPVICKFSEYIYFTYMFII